MFRTVTFGSFWILLLVVLLAGIPFGSARPWAWSLLALLTGLATTVWAVGYVMARPALRRPSLAPFSIATVAFLAVMVWALVQTLPVLPPGWQHPLWGQAGLALGQELRPSIALDREATIISVMRLTAAFLVFAVASFTCASRERAEAALRVVAVAVTLYAAYGLFIFFTGNETVAGFQKWAYLDSLTATFVNRNSFATFAGLGFLTVLALIALELAKLPPDLPVRFLLPQLLQQVFRPRVMLLFGAASVILTALLLTHSRAGLTSILAGVITLLLLSSRREGAGKLILTGGIGAVFIGLLLVGGGGTMARLAGTDLDQEERPRVYQLMAEAIETSPMIGYGLNNFGAVFPLFRDSTIKGYYDRGHSDHLELIMDLGIPATLILYAGFAVIVWHCLRGVGMRDRSRALPALGVAATVQVGLHGMVDFGLQIPAVLVLYAAVLGVGYAQATRHTGGGGRAVAWEPREEASDLVEVRAQGQ